MQSWKLIELKKTRVGEFSKGSTHTHQRNVIGVNIFQNNQTNISPKDLLGPMVCDESLRFNANESKLLSRGPKDMVRQELSLEEFRVQMEKMIVKQKLDNAFKDDMGDEDDLSGKPAMHRPPAPVKPTTNHTCSKAGNVSSEVSDRCKECIKEFNIK